MAILINEITRILVQGFTGDKATFHAQKMIEYGTKVVGGVTPGKGGQTHIGLPVFNTTKEAVDAVYPDASIIFVPAAFSADAIMEAADAGIRLVCCITDGIPAQDMMMVKRYLRRYHREKRTMLVGPNCAGIISPGKSMLGIMPGHIYMAGKVGLVTRSGTLGYEAASQMKDLNIGMGVDHAGAKAPCFIRHRPGYAGTEALRRRPEAPLQENTRVALVVFEANRRLRAPLFRHPAGEIDVAFIHMAVGVDD